MHHTYICSSSVDLKIATKPDIPLPCERDKVVSKGSRLERSFAVVAVRNTSARSAPNRNLKPLTNSLSVANGKREKKR